MCTMQNVKLTSSWGLGLLEILSEMQKKEEMCDLHLVLKGGVTIKVHSCVIAAASPFLKSLLINTQNPEINMEDFPSDVIRQIVQFIYTGELSIKNDDLIMLHNVAISLHFPVLVTVTQKLIYNSDDTGTPDPGEIESRQDNCPEEDNCDIISDVTSIHSTSTKTAAPSNRKSECTRKQRNSAKSPSDKSPHKQVDGLCEKVIGNISLQCSEDPVLSPKKLPDAFHETKLSGIYVDTNPDLKVKAPLSREEESKISEARQQSKNNSLMTSDLTRDVNDAIDPHCSGNVLIKLEKDENDTQVTPKDRITEQVDDLIKPYQTVVKQSVLNTMEGELNVASSLTKEPQLSVTSGKYPRKKTAQGAALAAKVPIHVGPTFTCMTCNRSFTNEDMYNRHCSRHRNNTTDVKRFVCQFCKFSTMYKAVLDEHVHVHTGEKPYACTKCDKAFKHRKSLQIHMWIHAGKKYPCPLCGKEMSTAQYMRRHMNNVHSDYRPYKCSICNRCFNRSESLNKHMDTHNEVAKYECIVCSGRFLTQIALKNHVANKHKERPRYCCLKCGNEFVNLHKIKSHRCQPPDGGKKVRRNKKGAEQHDDATSVIPWQSGPVQSKDTHPAHGDEPVETTEVTSTEGTSSQDKKDVLVPDHIYTPKKEASQVMIVSGSTADEEIEDTDGETSSDNEDDDDGFLNMSLDEQENE